MGILFSIEFLAASIRASSPIIGAAVGESISERVGVLNIGLEGMMLTGAFCGVLGSMLTGSVWAGVACAVLAGASVGALHALLVLIIKADQILCGVAINFAALGLTTFLSRTIFGRTPDPVAAFESVPLPLLSDIPWLGDLLFNHVPPVYLIYLTVPIAWWILFRSHIGLRMRAIGEAPEAAAATGIPVIRYQFFATVACGAMAGLAGTYASLGSVRFFTENMTAGNGFIALALVIVGRWNPLHIMAIGILFGAVWSLALRSQTSDALLPYEVLLMLPYVLTLVVYFIAGGKRSGMPAALGRSEPA